MENNLNNSFMETNIFYNKLAEVGTVYLNDKKEIKNTTKKEIENEIKDSLNLTNYYIHDINLDEEIINMYYLNDLIYHPGELYFTKNQMGINKNCRFLVISNRMDDLSRNEDGNINEKEAYIGLCCSDMAESYKIIDIYKKNGKTQITLINYSPILEEFFKNNYSTTIEKEFITNSREHFNKSLKMKHLSELDSEEWNYFFTEPIGIRKYEGNYEYFLKEYVLKFLSVLGGIEDTYDINIVIEFINQFNMTSLFNVIESEIEKEINKLTNPSEELVLKTTDICVKKQIQMISLLIKKYILNRNLSETETDEYITWRESISEYM